MRLDFLNGAATEVWQTFIKFITVSALDTTVKSLDMRKGVYECIEHNRKNRKKAIDEMPYASKVVAVVGGYIGFESWDDYEIWRNQK